MIDPIRVIKSVMCCQHLRSQRAFSEALDDAFALAQDSDDETQRDHSADVSRALLDRGFSL